MLHVFLGSLHRHDFPFLEFIGSIDDCWGALDSLRESGLLIVALEHFVDFVLFLHLFVFHVSSSLLHVGLELQSHGWILFGFSFLWGKRLSQLFLSLDRGVDFLILNIKVASQFGCGLLLVESEGFGRGGAVLLSLALQTHLELLLEPLEVRDWLGSGRLECAKPV